MVGGGFLYYSLSWTVRLWPGENALYPFLWLYTTFSLGSGLAVAEEIVGQGEVTALALSEHGTGLGPNLGGSDFDVLPPSVGWVPCYFLQSDGSRFATGPRRLFEIHDGRHRNLASPTLILTTFCPAAPEAGMVKTPLSLGCLADKGVRMV